MPLAFIVNPAAGGGRAARVWKMLAPPLERDQVPYRAYMTEGPGHASRLAARTAADHAGLVVVGGDGTLHEVVNGLGVPTPVPVGLIPCGTGNDFARSVGLPRRPEQALAAILSGRQTRYDVGRVNDRYFVNVAGVGFDAAVAARVNTYRYWKQGALPYLWAALSELRRRSCVAVELAVDGGESRPCNLFLAAVGNGNQYAGGFQICPGAVPYDGYLDLCIVQDVSRLQVLSLMPRVFTGSHIHHPQVQLIPARQLTITGPSDVQLHADGENIGQLPVTFAVEPASLTFFAPDPPARDRE